MRYYDIGSSMESSTLFSSLINRCICMILFVSLLGCSNTLLKNPVIIEPLKGSDIQGTVNLILYGANYANDLETIAILDKTGDGYEFEPFAPDFRYRIKKNIPAIEALKEAEIFVSRHSSFQGIRFSKILDEKGIAIGYEVRPLYFPFTFGVSDVLDVDYRIKENKVVVTIRLINSVEKMLYNGDDGKGAIESK